MKKIFLFIFIIFLSFSSLNLLKPQSVLAANRGVGKFMLKAVSGPKLGEVTLTWIDADSADNYHLVYGTDSKKMQFGALNIGTNNVYTVGKLNPGTKYYFALVPVMNNMAMYTSEWVAAWPASQQGGSMGSQKMAQNQMQKVMGKSMGSSGPVGQQWLWGKTGPNAGDVTLYWRHTDDANNYHLVYGTQAGNYSYGALNIGWVTSYTVHRLNPGTTYYFALVPVKNDTALYTTKAVKVMAKTVMQIVQTTPEAVMQPKASIAPIVGTIPPSGKMMQPINNNTVNNTVNYPATPDAASGQ